MKTCYYELLGVDSGASDTDLKKAYRRKALQYHPDKNIGNVQQATEIFASIRAAYEVLSDAQERAWYDAHREQILNDDFENDEEDYTVDSAVTGVTTEEILHFFNSGLYTRIDDTPAGLYQIAGKVFAKLAKDELICGRRQGLAEYSALNDDQFEKDIIELGYVQACEKYQYPDQTVFPVFGYSATSYEDLRAFYKAWGSFNTVKSFSWEDEYMYSRNYDRRTKREINKRNEKKRTQAKNEYNKTVRRFVTFIKKFDRRMKEGAKRAEAEKKRKLQETLRKQIEKDRLANEQSTGQFKLQSWQTVDQQCLDDLEKHFAGSESELKSADEEVTVLIYDCFVCNKNFKSERQLQNHNNTRSHRKAVRQIQWEMKKDSLELGLDEISDLEEFDSAYEDAMSSGPLQAAPASDLADIMAELAEIEQQLQQPASPSAQPCFEIDDQVESGEPSVAGDTEEPAVKHTDPELDRLLASLVADEQSDDWDALPNKRSRKKQTKSAKRASATQTASRPFTAAGHRCASCSQSFESRNKLFQHVQSLGHGAPPQKVKKQQRKA
ncbi:ABL194Cp [Eremothecium gossypii ATCC 10895]|uniref:ABL194Cp n=1 Tax=Eremothecium gossypii (strain ATCC 10895 / CBS 109.51 / FGSC 9923 / NRRL Y-1056) TaxID=284811 RepID=Q75E64_EREGS|nr:ABL194Cp [Eremothecium gossypii ATCC 10895]AAS50577.1 ABL194Cp [Eremothecium gossypii ATCC 10895]AEY94865.1 FABL194Cp [Eremothecium gossypii FDAG1]